MNAARFVIAGRVQGVAFRAHAKREADARGITGHARNRDDGRVDVLACGDARALEAFACWLSHGPPLARVDAITREDIETAAPCDFRIG